MTDRNPDPTEWLEDSLYLGPAIREMDNHTGDGADRARAELATLKAKWEREAAAEAVSDFGADLINASIRNRKLGDHDMAVGLETAAGIARDRATAIREAK